MSLEFRVERRQARLEASGTRRARLEGLEVLEALENLEILEHLEQLELLEHLERSAA